MATLSDPTGLSGEGGDGGGPAYDVLKSGTITVSGNGFERVDSGYVPGDFSAGEVPVLLAGPTGTVGGFAGEIANDENNNNQAYLSYSLDINSGTGMEFIFRNEDSSDLQITYQFVKYPSP